MVRNVKVYPVFLHVMLIGLGIAVLILAQQNAQLRQALYPVVPQLEAGDQVGAVKASDLSGAPRALEWQGAEQDRLLLVFTTVCQACRQNQSAWRTLNERVGNNLEVVGISLDTAEMTQAYRDEHDLPFEVVVADDRQDFTASYEIPAVPFTIHVDGNGKVLGSWRGKLSEERLAEIASSVISRG